MHTLQNYFDQFVLCWLATVSEEGVPNVSPKELFVFEGEKHLLIANIASPQSVKNIQANCQLCVSGINIWTQKGLQCKGQAEVLNPQHQDFQKRHSCLKRRIKESSRYFTSFKFKPLKKLRLHRTYFTRRRTSVVKLKPPKSNTKIYL